MSFAEKLRDIIKKHDDINAKLFDFDSSSEYQKAAKEFATLSPIATKAREYLNAVKELDEIKKALSDSGLEQGMKSMMLEEVQILTQKLEQLDIELKMMMLPKDEADEKGAILEIRAGTGGEEAALFAANLLTMYRLYAERRGWKFELLNISTTGIDGCKEAVASISGASVFAKLKFESGVHRVQRVPETESSGRIHTSAATVAILPEVDEIDFEIRDEDIKIDTYRASGAGGQHVNTTDSAIRVTHIPTGVVVCQQDEKSQHKNRAKALKILRSRVYESQRIEQDKERSEARRGMIGSGDRSERIRTYNYPQGRVTDHRINFTLYNLNAVINCGELDQFIDKLIAEDVMLKLAEK